MKRNSRISDAKENASRWENLLSEAKNLLLNIRELKQDVEQTSNEIERTWDGTSREIDDIQTEVSEIINRQAADREADTSFDQSDASTPPRAVPDTASIHGNPDLRTETDYEVPNPVRMSEVRAEIEDIKELPAEERERPTPFTEQEWFELHSDQFPIGEDVFATGLTERVVENPDREPDERARESEAVDRYDRDERTTKEDDS